MMQPWTEGAAYHKGFRLAISYSREDIGAGTTYELNGYCVVLIREGTGIMWNGAIPYPIIAPAIYCFNHTEQIRLIAGTRLLMQSLRFRPKVLNERLDNAFQDVQHEGHEMLTTDYQDMWVMESFFERTDSYYGCVPIDPSVAKHADELLDEIRCNLNSQPDNYWPCRSRSYLMELLFLIRRMVQKTNFTAPSIPHAVSESIKPVIEYLHTHYKQKIKLEDLTSMFLINKTSLNEQFKKSTGLSLIAYLNKIRMQMADSMLRNTMLPSTEIMGMVGIRDDAHFIRSFRKYSGYSPAEYRTAYCWMLNRKS